jgi:UDP-N-acetylglucosamine 2-epimerase (non-hydrolysing)
LKKPVLIIRKFTERTESLDLGTSKLIGTEIKAIVSNISGLLDCHDKYLEMIPNVNPYGDGKASEKIADIIYNAFKR